MFRHVFNTVAAALASMFLAIALGLPMPQIVMVTVVIVMQPLTQQVLDKSVYRLFGTAAGALAAWLIGVLFSDSPSRFLLAVGVWVSLLTFAASFSQQLKAYSIVLTGYTPVLIGVPAVLQLGQVAAHAAERLAEVGLGIACSALVMLVNGTGTSRPAQPAAATQGAAAAKASGAIRAGKALLAALHPALGMLATASMWMLSAWPGGAMATLNTTVNCALVSLSPDPKRAARHMNIGTLAAVAMSQLLQLAYPATEKAMPHWLLAAPALALGAAATGRQQTLLAGLGYSITLCMLSWPSVNPAPDAAGIALSVPALAIICAVLQKLRQPPAPA